MNKTIAQLLIKRLDHWSVRRLAVAINITKNKHGGHSEMGKVKQAIQEVEEEVVSLVNIHVRIHYKVKI